MVISKVSKACAQDICYMLDVAFVQGSKDRISEIKQALGIEEEDVLE
jgi:hypothetical protein